METPPLSNTAAFYDGQSAREHVVSLTFSDKSITISGDTLDHSVDWAYTDIRDVDDQADHTVRSFRVMEGLGRLNVADEMLANRIHVLSPNLTKTNVPASAWKRIGLWGAGAVASVVLIIFVIIPGLANQLATMIPVDKEVALGKTSLKQIERFIGFSGEKPLTCNNPAGQAALEKMTARLTAHFDSPYPLDVRVFDHNMPNAFAVPGGHIVLFNGLIQKAGSPEEVAGVLGHEIGHVVHRDPTRLTLRSAGSVGILGMVFGDFAGGAVALVIAEQLIAANYSQDAESEADRFSHDLLAKAKLPSKPMAGFFDKLNAEYGGGSKFMSHLASHPDLKGRSDAAIAADSIKDKPFDAVLNPTEWEALKSICPPRKKEKPKAE